MPKGRGGKDTPRGRFQHPEDAARNRYQKKQLDERLAQTHGRTVRSISMASNPLVANTSFGRSARAGTAIARGINQAQNRVDTLKKTVASAKRLGGVRTAGGVSGAEGRLRAAERRVKNLHKMVEKLK